MIDGFTNANQLTDGQERVVRSNFTINMYGYIIPDIIQKDLASVKKFNSKSKIIFSMETTSNPEVFEPNPQVAPPVGGSGVQRDRLAENVNTRKRINTDE